MNTEILLSVFHFTSQHPILIILAQFFSDYLVYILPALIVFYVLVTEKNPITKCFFIISVTFAAVIINNHIIKEIFEIPRPFLTLGFHPLVLEPGFSFPSGHSAFAGALFGATYLSISKHPYVTFGVGVICFLIGLSRIMLGVHYPTDVLIGFVVGFIIALIGYKFEKKFV